MGVIIVDAFNGVDSGSNLAVNVTCLLYTSDAADE